MTLYGYHGKLLQVDLSSGETKDIDLDTDTLRDYVGGRGLGIKYLYELIPPGTDPLSPENPMIISTGPYTGMGVFSAFFSVSTKSPLTGLAAASHCGGRWGPGLKKAGYDAVILLGAAEKPCYLTIEEGRAELKTADDLWGQGVFRTEEILRENHGKVEVLAIGPAGENLVKYASMMNGHRAAGRGGVGAVLGSKKLKAIAVKGDLSVSYFDESRARDISVQGGKVAVENAKAFAKYGSSMVFSFFNEKFVLPTRNFNQGHFTEIGKIDAEALKTGYFVKDGGCHKCPLRCGNVHTISDGPYKLEEVEGPEYETLMSFGSNCGNDNLESILMANYLCNDLGLDTISCGDTFALLMDLYESGFITANDLDGYTMNWGDHESMTALIPKIAARQGVGDLLAEGSYRAAAKWGESALKRVIHSKKQEYPGYESRRSFGTGFSLVTSNRGACHLRAALYVNEVFMGEFEEKGFESNIKTLLAKEHYLALADSFLTCKFGMRNAQFTLPVLTELHNALTGFGFSEEDLDLIGERIWNLERLFNLREGEVEDMAPPRFFKEDLNDGKEGGQAISMERFLKALELYYTARGWDHQGRPPEEKLTRLGIKK